MPVQEEEPEEEEEEEEKEEDFVETLRDTEVPEEDTAPVKTKDLVTPAAQIVELELQVQNLEQLIAKA